MGIYMCNNHSEQSEHDLCDERCQRLCISRFASSSRSQSHIEHKIGLFSAAWSLGYYEYDHEIYVRIDFYSFAMTALCITAVAAGNSNTDLIVREYILKACARVRYVGVC